MPPLTPGPNGSACHRVCVQLLRRCLQLVARRCGVAPCARQHVGGRPGRCCTAGRLGAAGVHRGGGSRWHSAGEVLPIPAQWKMLPNQTFSMLGMFMTALSGVEFCLVIARSGRMLHAACFDEMECCTTICCCRPTTLQRPSATAAERFFLLFFSFLWANVSPSLNSFSRWETFFELFHCAVSRKHVFRNRTR